MPRPPRVFSAGGRHLWNSGMFVFTAATLLDEMERHAPAVLHAVRPRGGRAAARPRLHPPRREAPSLRPLASASTTPSPSAPTAPRWSPPTSAGPTSAVGGRCGNWGRRTRPATSRVGDVLLEGAQQLLRAQRRHPDRRGRPGRRRGGGNRGRGARHASRPRAGREEGRGPAEGRRPAEAVSAQSRLPPLGFLTSRCCRASASR